jgi:hypothetical protein
MQAGGRAGHDVGDGVTPGDVTRALLLLRHMQP